MSNIAQLLQPALPLVGNEEIYAAVTGIPLAKIKTISKVVEQGYDGTV